MLLRSFIYLFFPILPELTCIFYSLLFSPLPPLLEHPLYTPLPYLVSLNFVIILYLYILNSPLLLLLGHSFYPLLSRQSLRYCYFFISSILYSSFFFLVYIYLIQCWSQGSFLSHHFLRFVPGISISPWKTKHVDSITISIFPYYHIWSVCVCVDGWCEWIVGGWIWVWLWVWVRVDVRDEI